MNMETALENRRKKILELLENGGRIRVGELARLFGISEVSIRNDLICMERGGHLERTHGGAIPTGRTYYNLDFNGRRSKNSDEKKLIAAAAVSLVHDGDTVMLNSGSTCCYIASELKKLRNLKFITNSFAVSDELGHHTGIILLGGRVNTAYRFTFGTDAVNQLRGYNTDVVFLSVDGASYENGLNTFHEEEVEVNRTMLERAKRRVVVADFTKIGRQSFAFIAQIKSFDILITNENADVDELTQIERSGVQVIKVHF